MDGRRFDDLSRKLGAASSRRTFLSGLMATVTSGLVALLTRRRTAAAQGGAVQQPGAATPPHRFFGTVTLDGRPAPQGATLTALVGTTICGTATVTQAGLALDGDTYVIDVASTQTVPGCGTPGAPVTFVLDGMPATQTGTWDQGAFTRLDLTVMARPALRIAAPPEAKAFLTEYVSPHFHAVTGATLDVAVCTTCDPHDLSGADVVLAPTAQIPAFAAAGTIVPLTGYRLHLETCGGLTGSVVFVGGTVYALQFAVGELPVASLPSTHRFMEGEGLALAVINSRALETVEGFDFFLLSMLRLSVLQSMPILPDFESQMVIDVGGPTVAPAGLPDAVSVNVVRPSADLALIDLSFTNATAAPIRRVKAYIFNVAPSTLRNRHQQLSLQSRVNRIGPIAAYHFGPMMPGDRVTRRIVYDMNGGDRLGLGWNLHLAARPYPWSEDGTGTCATEKPVPIPDPFPEVLFPFDSSVFDTMDVDGACYDTGCSDVHGKCNPHSCRAGDGTDCGCFPDNPAP